MPNWKHTLALFAAITLAYLWLSIDLLRPYSLQIFALTIAVFFISKRMSRAKLWHIVPEHATLEITLLTFAFLLLIGATGNLASPFFFLSYVHLFFLVLATRPATAIFTTIAVALFHFGLDNSIVVTSLQTLLSLPMLLFIFLFAKAQYDEASTSKAIIADEADNLVRIEANKQSLEQFLTSFLQPRIQTLTELIANSATTRELSTQLSLINSEIEKLLRKE
ncbi:MAG: hypothetical protein GW947_04385 [Candidatus Pacebacteria bacterium]|nr:hypothetical protein [Candidatus Paceibacterota bacterium]PIR59645.1 MAG: hypothetical protein COU68_04520 [Candidatus Pacebacteria bacterium CG10_big_fil_rev_8_21_14_0_10_45_6]